MESSKAVLLSIGALLLFIGILSAGWFYISKESPIAQDYSTLPGSVPGKNLNNNGEKSNPPINGAVISGGNENPISSEPGLKNTAGSGGGGSGGGGSSGGSSGTSEGTIVDEPPEINPEEIPSEGHPCPENKEELVCDGTQDIVCGWFQSPHILCGTRPCVRNFGNACEACTVGDVLYWTPGECPLYE